MVKCWLAEWEAKRGEKTGGDLSFVIHHRILTSPVSQIHSLHIISLLHGQWSWSKSNKSTWKKSEKSATSKMNVKIWGLLRRKYELYGAGKKSLHMVFFSRPKYFPVKTHQLVLPLHFNLIFRVYMIHPGWFFPYLERLAQADLRHAWIKTH